jgi:hypothetical protein
MALELQGTVTAHVADYHVKSDQKNDGTNPQVTLVLNLSEEEALSLGGKAFAQACFGDYVGKSAAARAKSKKLGHDLAAKGEHTLTIEGQKVSLKLKTGGCEISGKERVVTVPITLTLSGGMTSLRANLEASCGEDIEVTFHGVTQQDIEDAAAAANGNGADHSNGNGASKPPGFKRGGKGKGAEEGGEAATA